MGSRWAAVGSGLLFTPPFAWSTVGTCSAVEQGRGKGLKRPGRSRSRRRGVGRAWGESHLHRDGQAAAAAARKHLPRPPLVTSFRPTLLALTGVAPPLDNRLHAGLNRRQSSAPPVQPVSSLPFRPFSPRSPPFRPSLLSTRPPLSVSTLHANDPASFLPETSERATSSSRPSASQKAPTLSTLLSAHACSLSSSLSPSEVPLSPPLDHTSRLSGQAAIPLRLLSLHVRLPSKRSEVEPTRWPVRLADAHRPLPLSSLQPSHPPTHVALALGCFVFLLGSCAIPPPRAPHARPETVDARRPVAVDLWHARRLLAAAAAGSAARHRQQQQPAPIGLAPPAQAVVAFSPPVALAAETATSGPSSFAAAQARARARR